jgi:hypothetical protein
VAIVTLTAGKQLGCGLAFMIGRWVTSPELRAACCLPRGRQQQERQEQQQQQRQGEEGESVDGQGRESQRSRTVRAMFLALEHHPWQITFLIRLLPIPISIKNYGMAMLPHCPLHVFMLTTLLAGIPFTVAWVYLGESCRSLLEALQGNNNNNNNNGQDQDPEQDFNHRHGAYAQELGFLLTGLAVAVALVLLLRRYTRRYSRLLAEREEAAAAETAAETAAAKAEEAGGRGEGEAAAPFRGVGIRDVSTASSSTTVLTLTPPPMARGGRGARPLLQADNEVGEKAGEEEEEEEGNAAIGLEEGFGVGSATSPRLGKEKRRRRRSSGSTCSSLSLDISSEKRESGGSGDTKA